MSIRITNLTKRFGSHPAVDDLSVDIAADEFFAIVGASGCGKSTLLRLIAGLEAADSGQIRLHGAAVTATGLHVAPEARNIGFVFQSYALWPHLDVRGNVAFPAETAGLTRAEARARADRHLATVALTPFADRRPAELSGGQRQRVALARCLAQEARTILMDEPLANLDPHLRTAMEGELLQFHKTAGATTIYITHDQREAMAVADRMAVMAAGRFLQVGPPADIYDAPASEAVARFIGQGAVVDVELRSGQARLAGTPLPLRGLSGPEGKRRAMLRPADLAPCPADTPGALAGRVTAALYRGGHSEASVTVDGIDTPLHLHLTQRVRPGDSLHILAQGGWLIPA